MLGRVSEEGGEFALIRDLAHCLGETAQGLPLGIGDDAAVLASTDDEALLVTTDALVEGVHFDRCYTPLEDLGWKSLAASVSDIAAMGGRPTAAVIAMALDGTWSPADAQALYRGVADCAKAYDVRIAGGDTTRSPHGAFIGVTLLGLVARGCAVRRSGARPGDLLGVTAALGGARCGLEALESKQAQDYPQSTRRFLRPEPSVQMGQWLARSLDATAMIDISDGLGSELGHLCDQSGTGCLIEAVPVTEEARRWALSKSLDPTSFVLASGEEYALLFACPPERAQSRDLAGAPEPLHWIGRMTGPKDGRLLSLCGEPQPLEARGWDHFA